MPRLMIWLLPDADTLARLEAASIYIREVAGDALPEVPPHLTVLSGDSFVDPRIALHESVSAVPPLTLPVPGPTQCPDPADPRFQFWKSLYVPLDHTSELRALRASCAAAFGLPQSPDFDPHVSLAYTRRSKRAKSAWLDTLARLGGSVAHASEPLRFETAQVRADGQQQDPETRIESWHELATASLKAETPS